MEKKNAATAPTFDGQGSSGATNRANGSGHTKTYPKTGLVASLLTGALLSMAAPASAQLSWDNTRSNPYVAAGYGDQCTAFAHGRTKTVNGEWFRYRNPQGASVYPNGGLMFDYAQETAQTVYRDSVPVRGALVSWRLSGKPGHAGTIERVNSDGSAIIAEQNWPSGSAPNSKTLTAAQLVRRSSTVGGNTVYYTLAGYVNPNRAPALGTMTTTRSGNMLEMRVPLVDEDNRDQRVLVAIFYNGQVVNGSTMTGTVKPNNIIYARWDNSRLNRGQYMIQFTTTDFKGLKTSKTVNFAW